MSMTRAGTVAVAVGLALLMLVALGAPPASAELKVSVGGYVKLDLEYQDKINSAGVNRALLAPSNVVFDQGPNKDKPRARNDQFIFEGKESRINITATDNVGGVVLKGFIEGDFFGAQGANTPFTTDTTKTGVFELQNSLGSNSGLFRLRHAFAQGTMPLGIGKLTILAGQFWHAFGNITDLGPPPTVDFSSDTRLFVREPQLKLTYAIPVGKDTLNLIGAVSPEAVDVLRTDTRATSSLSTTVDPKRQEGENVPAFTAKAQWMGSWVKAEVGGIFTQAKLIDLGSGTSQTASNSRRADKFAYGVQGTVHVPIGPLTLYGHADSLNGLSHHGNGSFSDVISVPLVGSTDDAIRLIRTVGVWGGASYKLTPTTSFNGLYEQRFAEASGFSGYGRPKPDGTTNAQADLVRQQAIHVNLLQQFWGRFQFGLEFARKNKDAFRNNHGSSNTYHAAFWYFF